MAGMRPTLTPRPGPGLAFDLALTPEPQAAVPLPRPRRHTSSLTAPATMFGSFPVTAGTTVYVYVRDTSSGTLPLDEPMQVTLSQ